MRILIVEDSPTDRQLLKYLLEDKFKDQAKFREAPNLDTAFKYLDMGNIDCVVLDLQLPDSAGKETFEKITERFPDVPVIIMTHSKDRDLAIEMIRMGAADYIIKAGTNDEDIFRRIVFAVEKHQRTIRMPTERVQEVRKIERAKAEMMTAHQSGQHMAIRDTTVATTAAVADISRSMFTELQKMTNEMAYRRTRDEQIAKTLETLETELLKGNGTRPSMRSQLDVLDHKVAQHEKRFSDFRQLTEKGIEEVRKEQRASLAEDRMSAVHIQQAHMSNRTKVLLGILGLVGTLATSYFAYELAKSQGQTSIPAPQFEAPKEK
jgi:DNA-binding NarL/FixJ family response regulator